MDRNIVEISTKTGALDVPRKGNVDRNVFPTMKEQIDRETFPARGTWIEIWRLTRHLAAVT